MAPATGVAPTARPGCQALRRALGLPAILATAFALVPHVVVGQSWFNCSTGTGKSVLFPQVPLTNKEIGSRACEAHYGTGNCQVGQCGQFTFWYRVGNPLCTCTGGAPGEYQWVYSKGSAATVSADTTDGGASASLAGVTMFVRQRIWYGCNNMSWKLVFRSLGDCNATAPTMSTPQVNYANVTTYPVITAGSFGSMILTADGQAYAAGQNTNGRFGDGTTTDRFIPIPLPSGGAQVTGIAMGDKHLVMLTTEGTVLTMGYGGDGALCDGTFNNRNTPTTAFTGVQTVAASSYATIVLKTDGTVWSCGSNNQGVLGRSGGASAVPGQVTGLSGGPIVAVVAGASCVLYLRWDGVPFGAGQNSYGGLGIGTWSDSYTAARAVNLTGIAAMAMGRLHGIWLGSDGTAYVSGRNYNGQLGDGSNTDRNTPFAVLFGVRAVGAGNEQTVFVMQDGTAYACGYGGYGGLGTGSSSSTSVPTKVLIAPVASVFVAYYHTLFLLQDGSVWASGISDNIGRMGNGDSSQVFAPIKTFPNMALGQGLANYSTGAYTTVTAVPGVTAKEFGARACESYYGVGNCKMGYCSPYFLWYSVTVGFCDCSTPPGGFEWVYNADAGTAGPTAFVRQRVTYLCGKERGTEYRTTFTSLGVANATEAPRNTTSNVPGLYNTDYSTVIVNSTGGGAVAFGDNTNGILGDGTNVDKYSGVRVRLPPTVTVKAVTGRAAAFFLTTTGDVYATGYNQYGELGDNTTTSRNLPVLVMSGVAQVAAGQAHTLFLRTDGKVVSVGLNADSQLGYVGSNTAIISVIPSLSGITYVAAGEYHSFFKRADGSIVAIGRNGYGQLGIGSSTSPIRVLTPVIQSWGDATIAKIVAPSTTTYFLTADGMLYSTGRGIANQLGDGGITSRSTPFLMAAYLLDVAANDASVWMLRQDYTVYSLGGNANGELAIGSAFVGGRAMPTRCLVGPVRSISASVLSSYFWLQDGTLWVSGNAGVKMGTGVMNQAQVNTPVQSFWSVDPPGQATTSTCLTGTGATFTYPIGASSIQIAVRACEAHYGQGQCVIGTCGTFSFWYSISVSDFCGCDADLGQYQFVYANTGSVRVSQDDSDSGTGGVTAWNALNVAGNVTEDALFVRRKISTYCSWLTWELTYSNLGDCSDSAVVTSTTTTTSWTTTGASYLADPRVAASDAHSLFLTSAGQVFASGRNADGRLGDGTTIDRLVPVGPLSVPRPVVAISAGNAHSFVLTTAGEAYGFGANNAGQIGIGMTTTNQTLPVLVASSIKLVVCGLTDFTILVKQDGTVLTFGSNTYGQLGRTGDLTTPAAISSLTGVVAAAAGSGSSYFVKADGTAWAVGRGLTGELGQGALTSSSTLIQVTALSGIQAVAAGHSHVLWLRQDGTLLTNGLGINGQLGDGARATRSSPVAVLAGVTAIAAGRYSSLFMRQDGTVLACGLNDQGQIGNGNPAAETTAANNRVLISGVRTFAMGQSHSLYLLNDGSVWAAGLSTSGQFGSGEATTRLSTPIQAAWTLLMTNQVVSQTCDTGGNMSFTYRAGATNKEIAARACEAQLGVGKCAIGTCGAFTYWYSASSLSCTCNIPMGDYQWVFANTNATRVGQDVTTSADSPYIGRDSLFVRRKTMMNCSWSAWELTLLTLGECNGVVDPHDIPGPKVDRNVLGLSGVYAGQNHTLFIDKLGVAYASGAGGSGRLGTNSTADKILPGKVAFESSVTIVAADAGAAFSIFLTQTGSVLGVGSNSDGQLGDGTNTDRMVPTLAQITNVVALDVGTSFALLLSGDGTVSTTGANADGQLGYPGPSRNIPAKIPDISGIKAVSALDAHAILLGADGRVWTFGRNNYGQIGNGASAGSQPTPYLLFPNGSFVAVSAGGQHSLFLDSRGGVWSVGRNVYGQLADSSGDRATPARVQLGVRSLAAGFHHSIFIRFDGTAMGAGWNFYGQLGAGYSSAAAAVVATPVKALVSTVAWVSAGAYYTMFFTEADSVWAAGQNANGQLGVGNTSSSATPQKAAPNILLFPPTTTTTTQTTSTTTSTTTTETTSTSTETTTSTTTSATSTSSSTSTSTTTTTSTVTTTETTTSSTVTQTTTSTYTGSSSTLTSTTLTATLTWTTVTTETETRSSTTVTSTLTSTETGQTETETTSSTFVTSTLTSTEGQTETLTTSSTFATSTLTSTEMATSMSSTDSTSPSGSTTSSSSTFWSSTTSTTITSASSTSTSLTTTARTTSTTTFDESLCTRVEGGMAMYTADPDAFLADRDAKVAMEEMLAGLVGTDSIFVRVALTKVSRRLSESRGFTRGLQATENLDMEYAVLVPPTPSTSPSVDSIFTALANAEVDTLTTLCNAALVTYDGSRFQVIVLNLRGPSIGHATTSRTTSSSTFTSTKFLTFTGMTSSMATTAIPTTSTETTQLSDGRTATSTTLSATATVPPPPHQVAAPLPACADVVGFSDVRGLTCEDWSVLDCLLGGNLTGYTQDALADVRRHCPVACRSCSVAAPFIVTDTKKVMSELALQVNLAHLDKDTRTDAFTAGFAAALGVPSSNVIYLQIGFQYNLSNDTNRTGGTSRRLQGFLQVYKVRYEVVVPPSKQVRDILLQATSLSVQGSVAQTTFSQVLGGGYGVDTNNLRVQVSSQPIALPVSVILQGDEVIGAPLTTGNASQPSGTGNIVAVSCIDEEAFIDEQGESCSAWVGLDCMNPKWLRTERPYTLPGLRRVLESCPLACGICDPPIRFSFEHLSSSCIDDPLVAGWCARWRGINCSSAIDLGYTPKYASLLLDRCPQSCGLCQFSAVTCKDVGIFRDEQGANCSSWNGSDCTKEYAGYTRKGMLEIQAACPASCGWCGTQAGASEPPRLAQPPVQCQDDANFSYLKQFICRDFVGHTCTYGTLYLEPRWLLGPHAVDDWHRKLWSSCRVSCARCDPPGRPTPTDLLIECEDDPYLAEWCAEKWKGQDCSKWQDSVRLVLEGEVGKYNATLFEHCPETCKLCAKPTCTEGTYRNRTAHVCSPCQPGRYAKGRRSGEDAQECALAEPGFSVPEAGATEQTPCDTGFFTTEPGQSQCSSCPAGQYSDFRGMSSCIACTVGWFQDTEGSTACKRCLKGTYAAANATVTCDVCPLDYTTELQASTAIAACVCPPGTYKPYNDSGGPMRCKSCPQAIVCPGGHSYVNASFDPTPLLMEGVMSLPPPEDPFAAYMCTAADACLTQRPLPYTEADLALVCPDFTWGPRCWNCPDNSMGAYHDSDNQCQPCGSSAGRFWKFILFFFAQLGFMWNVYRQEGTVQTGAKLVFLSALNFMQVLFALSQIPLAWPPNMAWFLGVLTFFSYDGILSELVDFRVECYFGVGLLPRALRDVCLPLMPFINFAVIAAVHRLLRLKMAWGAVANVIASMYFGFFVNLAVMALQLFPGEEMPNGKLFLVAFPGVEIGSSEWKKGVPVCIVAIASYCVTFMAYVLHSIIVAPHKTEDEWFMESRDWMVGEVNPQTFWWPAVDLMYGFSIALIQAVSPNVYFDMYLEMLVLLGYTMLIISYSPSTYGVVNKANMALNVGLLIFMAFGTGFVDMTLLDQTPNRKDFGIIVLSVMLCVLIYLTLQIGWALYRMCFVSPLQENIKQAHRARIMLQALIQLPEARFLGALGPDKLFDPDLQILKDGNKVLISYFLKQQPGRFLYKQRIIKGSKTFKVFDESECRRKAWGKTGRSEAFRKLEESAHLTEIANALASQVLRPIAFQQHRLQLQEQVQMGPIISYAGTTATSRSWTQDILAQVLPKVPATHVEFEAGDPDAPKSLAAVGLLKLLKQLENNRSGLGQRLAARARKTLNGCGALLVDEEAFVRELRDKADIPEGDLRQIFRYIDVNKQGQLKASHVVATLLLLGDLGQKRQVPGETVAEVDPEDGQKEETKALAVELQPSDEVLGLALPRNRVYRPAQTTPCKLGDGVQGSLAASASAVPAGIIMLGGPELDGDEVALRHCLV